MPFSHTVLQVIPELETGGAERTTVEITRAIAEAGGRALVASRGGRLAGEIEAGGGRVIAMPVHSKNPLTILRNRGRLLRLIREEKVEIIHARSRAPAWSALWAAQAGGIPLVATYHGAYRAQSRLKRFYNSAMVRADLVIANSEFTREAIRAQYAIDPEKLIVIPRGADLTAFFPEAARPDRIAALVQSWGLDPAEEAFRVLLPARLTPWKGQEVAVEAGAALAGAALTGAELAGAELARSMATSRGSSGQAGDLRIVFAGDAQGRRGFETALRDLIAERGVRDMINLVGHCADMPAAYGWADAVIAPSTRPEAFGRVAVEAAAMERPVIAADHGGARETVIDGETGFLVPPGDAEALAQAIARLAAMSPGERRKMGVRARARVQKLYSVEAMCAATLGAYEKIIQERLAAA